MTKSRLFAVLFLSALLSACGGNGTRASNCDDGLRYQNQVEGKRVVAPDGMDSLQEYAEMPIPRADPDAAKPPSGRCVDMPPSVG